MKILKFTQYVYLLFSVVFIYDGVTKYLENEPSYWLSFLIAIVAVFMFFFRRKFSRKFENKQ